MGLLKSIVNSELAKHVGRYSAIIAVDLTASIGLYHLWNRGCKYLVSTATLCCIGGTYLYCRWKSRDKLSSNQAIIITGCDSGLGYSLALHCRQLGATVISSVLNVEGPAAQTLGKEGVFVHHLDVRNIDSVKNFVQYVRTILEKNNLVLRCLINNSGVMVFGEFEWQTDDQIRNQVEVNVLGTMRITREMMAMIRRNRGRIIVVCSHCSIEPLPGVAPYSGAKSAVFAWAMAIRVELKKFGVKVVCLIPGSFASHSSILSRQVEHFDTMHRLMPEEAKTFYGEYFTRYSKYFGAVAIEYKVKKLDDPSIYRVFDGALLDKYPSTVYKNEPWRYFIYHSLLRITPTCLRDKLLLRFVNGPSWTERDVNEPSTPDTGNEPRDPDTSEDLNV